MSMKSESRIFNALLHGAPALLLTLACAGVAQAQLAAPIMTLPCPTLPASRVYSITAGTTPAAITNPYIRASDLASWSFPGAASDSCAAVGSARACAGLAVTLPGGSANQIPAFTGTATSAGTEEKITIKATQFGDACTAEFTIRVISSGGGGWGEPEPNGGAGGGGGDAAMAGAEANGGGGGATGGGGDEGGAEANGGAKGGDAGEAGSPSSSGASGAAITSGGAGLGGNVGNASGAGSGGIHAGGVPAAAPDDTSGESSGCGCSLPGQAPSSNRSAGTAIMIALLFGLRRRTARRCSQSGRV
jgi:MYXO-CTERM domain-containing protein